MPAAFSVMAGPASAIARRLGNDCQQSGNQAANVFKPACRVSGIP
jgi:hypothetical protein